MLFLASWRFNGASCRGFVRAKNERSAVRIMKSKLAPGAVLIWIAPAYESQITPQSLTVNFRNTSEYCLF